MSDNAALLSLVRLNPLSATLEHEYTAGELFSRHDEIRLVDPSGVPCAIPAEPRYEDRDFRYGYITADRGWSVRQLGRTIILNVDYIDASIHQRLEEWMQQRARVLLNPGFGRHTMLAYRPTRMIYDDFENGDPARDLTGNHLVRCQQPETPLCWDEATGAFLKAAAAPAPAVFHRTPGGAAWAAPKPRANRMYPPQPQSATWGVGAGTAGWQRWGVDAATDLTATHHTDAGHPDFTSYIRVAYAERVCTNTRALGVQSVWTLGDPDFVYQFLTSSAAAACIWLRGRAPDACTFSFGPVAGPLQTIDIGGMNMPQWTPFFVALHNTNWSAQQPTMKLSFDSVTGQSGSLDVGAVQVTHDSSAYAPMGPWWNPAGAAPATVPFALETASAFSGPVGCATVHFAFYVPSWYYSSIAAPCDSGLIGDDGTRFGLTLRKGASGTSYIRLMTRAGATLYDWNSSSVASLLNAGAINTVTVTFAPEGAVVYVNGALFAHQPAAATYRLAPPGFDGSTRIRLGTDYYGNGCWPLKLLHARLDSDTWSADDVMNAHLANVDPIALAVERASRGRVYRITGIPGTMRGGYGPSHVVGQIVLEQVDYLHHYADPFNEEGSTP